ncbi:MAG: 2-phosphosulfolactate phosphatase [Cytophagales bacterium]|nr:2-phosphosulfolactate phosphatase [Cytophagales bacterium]MDW8384539.1 2-phosphosulfolactate phosphatase [Flammeovirgaceae bacterium]
MPLSVETCLTPELSFQHDFTDKTAVIIDIFRATSCITTGLNHGVVSIKAVSQVEECFPYRQRGYLAAGERDGRKIEGFDLGNSPFEFMSQKGKKIVMTTTNGTQAILKAKGASHVVLGAFLNFDAVAEYIVQKNKNVVLVCAGWKGKYSLEDSLFAGALAKKLFEFHFQANNDDATTSCLLMYERVASNLKEFVALSSHYQRLRHLNVKEDLDYCITFNLMQGVAELQESGEISLFR